MTIHHKGGRLLVPRSAPRDLWLAERRTHICASDIAKALGVAPRSWGGEYSVWAVKTGLDTDEYGTYQMLVGQLIEDAIIDLWLARQTDVEWVKPPRRSGLIESRSHPLFAATPDRRAECTRGRCGVEAKKTGDERLWGTELEPLVPTHYHFQGQGQILADGWDHVHFVAMGEGWLPLHRRVDRDQPLIDRICDVLEPWWEKRVIGGEAPMPTGADQDTLIRQYASSTLSKAVTLPPDLQDLVLDLHAAKQRATEGNREVADLQARLELYLGQQQATEALWPDGSTAYTWNVSDKTIDGADRDWRAREPALAAEYMYDATVRKLDVAKIRRMYPTKLPAGLRYRRTFDLKKIDRKGPEQ